MKVAEDPGCSRGDHPATPGEREFHDCAECGHYLSFCARCYRPYPDDFLGCVEWRSYDVDDFVFFDERTLICPGCVTPSDPPSDGRPVRAA